MTSPAQSGSPLRRLAGLALLGIGVIAAIIGVATLFLDGSGNGTQTAAPATTASPGAPAPGATPTVPAAPTFTPAPPPAALAPGGDAGSKTEGSGVSHREPIRVYNNSTITGLAANAAADFEAAGWTVAEVANYPFGILYSSTVYYRPDTSEQAAAEELGREFGLRVHERFEGIEDASPGVIVIVTNDYKDA